jgi:cytochrome d ubiquinol oxidase subunit II
LSTDVLIAAAPKSLAARRDAIPLALLAGRLILFPPQPPLAFPRIAERWFSEPNILYLWPVPRVTALVAFAAWRDIRDRRPRAALRSW